MVEIDFNNYTTEELIDLNKKLVEHIKLRRQRESQLAMHAFEVGDRVSFKNSNGRFVEGEIVRFNQKSVTVMTDCHHKWRVSPQLVSKVFKSQKVEMKPAKQLPLPNIDSNSNKLSRNVKCPCGSGRKFKRCCLFKTQNLNNGLGSIDGQTMGAN